LLFKNISTNSEYTTIESSALQIVNITTTNYQAEVESGKFNEYFYNLLTQYGVSNVTAISASSTAVTFEDVKFSFMSPNPTLTPTYYPSYHPTVSPTSNDQIFNSVPSSGTDCLSLTFLLVYVSASLCLIALCMVLFYFRLYGAYFRFKDSMSVKDLHDTDFGIFDESPSDVMPYRTDSIGFKESKVENFLNYDDTSNISSTNGLYHRNYGPKDESRPSSNLSSHLLKTFGQIRLTVLVWCSTKFL